MPATIENLLMKYVEELKKIYGEHLQSVILYGSYARGDFNEDSDIDIMILLDISDMEIKDFGESLSYITYDFNMDNDLDIKPIAKSKAHFMKWRINYPFYAKVYREGVRLFEAA